MKELLVATMITVAAVVGCADGTIVFIDDDNNSPDTIKIEGNIFEVDRQVARADIIVFVFTGLVDDGTFENFEKQRSVAIAFDADPMEFTVTQVEAGDLTVVFLLDHADEPDGRIDPGDEFATLSDPDEILEGTRRGQIIRITDVTIDFSAATAHADAIRSVPDSGSEEED